MHRVIFLHRLSTSLKNNSSVGLDNLNREIMSRQKLMLLNFFFILILFASCENVIRRRKRFSRPNRSDRPYRDSATNDYLQDVPNLERTTPLQEENIFLQVDYLIYIGSRKNADQLKSCCDTVLREGISMMVEDATQDMENVLDARSLYFFLKEKDGEICYIDSH